MGQWFETGRGVVFPWQCDHFGHMNVRWYSHFFDDAGFQLWSVAGISHGELRAHGAAVVVAQNTIRYQRELGPGDLVVIRSAFIRIGTRSITHLARMFHADSGTLHASGESVEVFFDTAARKSMAMPDDFRARLEALVVDPDEA